MACRRVLQDIRSSIDAEFPPDPAPPASIKSGQDALSHIADHAYWKKQAEGRRNWNSAHIATRIEVRGQEYGADIASGAWVKTFSGKEIFRHVRTVVPGLCDIVGQGYTPAQNDENLALRMVTVLQRPTFAQSPTLQLFKDLRSALRKRANLPP